MQIPQHTNEYFTVKYSHYEAETQIMLSMLKSTSTTKDSPHTYFILKENLPTILSAQCFNPKNLNFAEEVKETEWGHLFEHILLEYLCIEKINMGYRQATHNGETVWKYHKPNDFHIKIDAGTKDEAIWDICFYRTIALMKKILAQKKQAVS
jgi:hypothetical protein